MRGSWGYRGSLSFMAYVVLGWAGILSVVWWLSVFEILLLFSFPFFFSFFFLRLLCLLALEFRFGRAVSLGFWVD